MISEEEFAAAERRAGRAVHAHDGVWWVRVAPFYCKPVAEFRAFPRSEARPGRLSALLGYSHQVREAAEANRFVRWMLLDGEALRTFSLESLPGKKRNQVRMGLRNCQVGPISDFSAVLEEMRLLNISQARRLEGLGEGGTFLPSTHYDQERAHWEKEVRARFEHPGHAFYGAWAGEKLAAYAEVIRLEGTWMLGTVKSASESQNLRPVDALHFDVLRRAAGDQSCVRVVNGGREGERQSLTAYKEQFLFREVAVPYFSHSAIDVERLKRISKAWSFMGGVGRRLTSSGR